MFDADLSHPCPNLIHPPITNLHGKYVKQSRLTIEYIQSRKLNFKEEQQQQHQNENDHQSSCLQDHI